MLVHNPENLQNTLDYLNYSGIVFYRDSKQFIQEKQSHNVPKNPITKKIKSNRIQIPNLCLLCATTITDEEYKVLGRNLMLCSACKPLFAEITII
ncbi:MAG: hypothetical protein ACXADY_23405 [Candidatus Hodarchaeales archaeon]|jgi:hypothetical protein